MHCGRRVSLLLLRFAPLAFSSRWRRGDAEKRGWVVYSEGGRAVGSYWICELILRPLRLLGGLACLRLEDR